MKILITGVTGMDGWYLAEQRVAAGDEVYGLVHGQRERDVPTGVHVRQGDLLDQTSLMTVLRDVQPDVVYNLAAITSIGLSWNQPDLMSNVTGLGVLRLLDAIRIVDKDIRVVQASTADQFGINDGTPLDETAPFAPRSPYGVAKQFAHDICMAYRAAYGMHVSTLIMFNHSGFRHGREFVVRKITNTVARIFKDVSANRAPAKLQLGRLDAVRDWGYAPNYVRAYPLVAALDDPDDFVIATGVGHTVEDLVRTAFDAVNLPWQDFTTYDQNIGRPADVQTRIGNPDRAKRILGWEPTISFEQMIELILAMELRA